MPKQVLWCLTMHTSCRFYFDNTNYIFFFSENLFFQKEAREYAIWERKRAFRRTCWTWQQVIKQISASAKTDMSLRGHDMIKVSGQLGLFATIVSPSGWFLGHYFSIFQILGWSSAPIREDVISCFETLMNRSHVYMVDLQRQTNNAHVPFS